MRILAFCLVSCLVLVAPAAALAQSDPAFLQTDRVGDKTRFGATLGRVSLDSSDQSGYHFDAFGQWMARGNLGAYGVVPLNLFTTSDSNESAPGNIEVGGVWLPGTLPWPVVVRGGITLPTAPANDIAGSFANRAGQLARFADTVLGESEVTWARASASAFFDDGQAFYRVDVGLDVALFGDRTDNVSHTLRINGAAGMNADNVAIMAELLTHVGLEDPGQNDRFLHVLSVGGRYLAAGDFQPAVSLVLPLDEELRDFFGYALVASIEYVLPAAPTSR